MKSYLRWFFCAAILLNCSILEAANVVPGMEVIVRKGPANIFRGVTDGRGRFETGPLEPGVYTIEVRTVPNTPPTSARFFLALAGAKPVGEATIRPGVALAMDAMVRNQTGIRGQVSARGGIVYLPRVPAQPNSAATPAPAVIPPLRPSPTPAPRMAQIAKPLPPNRAPVPQASVVSNSTTTTSALPPTPPSPATVGNPDEAVIPPAAYPPKTIEGRRYFWVPLTPGNNLGRWLPENPARPGTVVLPKSKPAKPTASPKPSRTQRRS